MQFTGQPRIQTSSKQAYTTIHQNEIITIRASSTSSIPLEASFLFEARHDYKGRLELGYQSQSVILYSWFVGGGASLNEIVCYKIRTNITVMPDKINQHLVLEIVSSSMDVVLPDIFCA